MRLNEYTTLGRTGLRVSPLCLGAMGFGTGWGWGAEEKPSFQMLDKYWEGGGNFIDTADGYQMGQSEEIVGRYVVEHKLRDKAVLATKFTFNFGNLGNPNAGGNGRKNIYRALEGSLRRLQTDYIDLYYLHAWDLITPIEEVVATLTDLVRQGKIRYYGLSDTPAWYFTRAQTLAEKGGLERCATLQLEYSLAERNIEREHIPAAQELGIGLCPWSPLSGGLLSGKYKREGSRGVGEGRLTSNPIFDKFTEHNWRVLDVLLDVSKQIGRAPAQVALNWLVGQPGVTSVILGATKPAQLAENLTCLDFTIPTELRKRLEEVGKPEPVHPYNFYEPFMQSRVSGNTTVREWRRGYLYEGAIAPPAEKKATAD